MYVCMYACILSSAGPRGLGGAMRCGGRAAGHSQRVPVRNRPTPQGVAEKRQGSLADGGIYTTHPLSQLLGLAVPGDLVLCFRYPAHLIVG